MDYVLTTLCTKMQPSQIQLKDMRYLGIKVSVRTLEKDNDTPPEDFNFQGVEIGERAQVVLVSDEDEPPMFAVRLQITITNETGKLAPYDLDIDIAGFFTISDRIEKEKQEEFVTVNGCAVLYSAIRDQVMTLTARSHHGTLILPTVNFLDKIKKKEPDKAVEKPRRKASVTAKKKT